MMQLGVVFCLFGHLLGVSADNNETTTTTTTVKKKEAPVEDSRCKTWESQGINWQFPGMDFDDMDGMDGYDGKGDGDGMQVPKCMLGCDGDVCALIKDADPCTTSCDDDDKKQIEAVCSGAGDAPECVKDCGDGE